jgi:hypothetical protein
LIINNHTLGFASQSLVRFALLRSFAFGYTHRHPFRPFNMDMNGDALLIKQMPDGMVTLMPNLQTDFDISVLDNVNTNPTVDSQSSSAKGLRDAFADQVTGRKQHNASSSNSSCSRYTRKEATENQLASVHRASETDPLRFGEQGSAEFLIDPPSVPLPSSVRFYNSVEDPLLGNHNARPQLSRLSYVGNNDKGPVSAGPVPAPSLRGGGLCVDYAPDRVHHQRSAISGNNSILQQLFASRVGLLSQSAEEGGVNHHTSLVQGMNCVSAMDSESYRVDARAFAEMQQQQYNQRSNSNVSWNDTGM